MVNENLTLKRKMPYSGSMPNEDALDSVPVKPTGENNTRGKNKSNKESTSEKARELVNDEELKLEEVLKRADEIVHEAQQNVEEDDQEDQEVYGMFPLFVFNLHLFYFDSHSPINYQNKISR